MAGGGREQQAIRGGQCCLMALVFISITQCYKAALGWDSLAANAVWLSPADVFLAVTVSQSIGSQA
jgi:hypothetical protein